MWEIKIQPIQFYADETKPKITSLRIYPYEHTPDLGLKYAIQLLRDGIPGEPDFGRILDKKEYLLTGSDYNNWVNDSPYLEQLILNFIGAVKVS